MPPPHRSGKSHDPLEGSCSCWRAQCSTAAAMVARGRRSRPRTRSPPPTGGPGGYSGRAGTAGAHLGDCRAVARAAGPGHVGGGGQPRGHLHLPGALRARARPAGRQRRGPRGGARRHPPGHAWSPECARDRLPHGGPAARRARAFTGWPRSVRARSARPTTTRSSPGSASRLRGSTRATTREPSRCSRRPCRTRSSRWGRSTS